MLLVNAGLELRGKDRNNEWFVYELYVIPGHIVAAKKYYWGVKPKNFVIMGGYTVESTEEPTLISESSRYELLEFFKEKRKEISEVLATFGLWYPSLYIVPYERREIFENLVMEKLGETAYYYSSIIPYNKFLEILEEAMNN